MVGAHKVTIDDRPGVKEDVTRVNTRKLGPEEKVNEDHARNQSMRRNENQNQDQNMVKSQLGPRRGNFSVR